MEELKEIEFATSEEETEIYLEFKTLLIESIEKFKSERTNCLRYYEEEVAPQLNMLEKVVKEYENSEDEEEIKMYNYAVKKLESAERQGVTKEAFEEKANDIEALQEKYENVLRTYFKEEIVNGKAVPQQKALNYCEIAKMLSPEE